MTKSIDRLSDCEIDWKNYESFDENGNLFTEDLSEDRDEELEYYRFTEYNLADKENCRQYYILFYYEYKLREYIKKIGYKSDYVISFWGLVKMFNDGWLASPAFVDWSDMNLTYYVKDLKGLLNHIDNPNTCVEILKYFIKNAEFLYGKRRKKEVLPELKNLLTRYEASAKIHNEEQKRIEKEQKAKNKAPKEKPEYILSVDEIIHYAKNNPDAAVAISGMLRYYAFEKEAWFNKTIRNKINEIEKHLLLIQAEKVSFEDKVENVKISERK